MGYMPLGGSEVLLGAFTARSRLKRAWHADTRPPVLQCAMKGSACSLFYDSLTLWSSSLAIRVPRFNDPVDCQPAARNSLLPTDSLIKLLRVRLRCQINQY